MDMTKISLQVGVVSLSAEGSEAFVREMLAVWNDLVQTSPANTKPTATATPQGDQVGKDTGTASVTGIVKFGNVFDSVDGRLKIIADIPGKSNAEKTRNIALLLLYGHLLLGTEQVASEAIRQACVDQGCYDSTNFASYLKGLKSRVVMNTKSGGGYDVKLTAPGRKDAKELVEALNGAD